MNKLPIIENGLEPIMARCLPRRLLVLVAMRAQSVDAGTRPHAILLVNATL